MLAKISTAALIGLSSHPVEVEVDIGYGLPNFYLVGLGAAAVQESRERVRSAIRNSKLPFPVHRITVNLAPASLKKDGSQYDLPIATGILAANQLVPAQPPHRLFYGELSLNGQTRFTKGVLAILLEAVRLGFTEAYIPVANQAEAAIAQVPELTIYPVTSLTELTHHLGGDAALKPVQPLDVGPLLQNRTTSGGHDFADIRGQTQVKRSLEIAAAGHHNILLIGPPGSGKTLLARSLPSILPGLSIDEAMEVTKLYSAAGYLDDQVSLVTERPFRSPHHTASSVAVTGGGSQPRPGEISLAHRGVLFLDEAPEFKAEVLEGLRQPLEDKVVTVARAAGSVVFPADFMLVAAGNPCPCGYYGSGTKSCNCSTYQVQRYQKRLSGPLLDRIDLLVTVPPVEEKTLLQAAQAEASAAIQTRVSRARQIQLKRFLTEPTKTNGGMTPKAIKAYCTYRQDVHSFLKQILAQYQLSARSFYRLVKVGRTIADLDGSDMIEVKHLAEACLYRFGPN